MCLHWLRVLIVHKFRDRYILLNPTIVAFVQWDILMSFQNIGFSSAKIRALFGVLYTDTYDDGVLLHRFMFLFLCDCTDCIIMQVRLLHVLNQSIN